MTSLTPLGRIVATAIATAVVTAIWSRWECGDENTIRRNPRRDPNPPRD